jgi:hypothetical protein
VKNAKTLLSALLVLLWSAPASATLYRGRIIDAVTKKPIAAAFVTLQDIVVQTDENGRFEIGGGGERVGIRAYGHRRKWVDANSLRDESPVVELEPLIPKALYLSFFGIGNATLRQSALDLIEATELNALVIDVKGDRGMIAYRSVLPLATQVGAQNIITIKDLKGLIAFLQAKDIYTVARVVVFKDNPLGLSRPDLAVKTRNGSVWRDRERLAWSDPFQKEVQDYNIEVAVEAAKSGFDEIQFDYVRFPDAKGLVFSQPSTEKSRIETISTFLQEARAKLIPYNVFLAADIFGYVCWNLDDTGIGQRLEDLAPHLDFISPMLYPSCFHLGIPGYRNPVAHPYEIVSRSLKRAKERTGLPSYHFRPWLQAFKDYAFDRREFTGKEIREQIKAAEDFASNGWMLWNPRNKYSADGLRKDGFSLLTPAWAEKDELKGLVEELGDCCNDALPSCGGDSDEE